MAVGILKELHHPLSTQDHGENPQVPWNKRSQPRMTVPLRDMWKCLETFFVVTKGGVGTTGICWGDVTKYITMQSTDPTTKNYQAPEVNSVEVEKPCHGRTGRRGCRYTVQLTLEQHGLELCGPTYMQIFFNKYTTICM